LLTRSAGRFSAHHRIAGEPLGIVDVFVLGEAAVDGLAQQAEQPVADVHSTPTLGKSRTKTSTHMGNPGLA
jgi:hypothetical protein